MAGVGRAVEVLPPSQRPLLFFDDQRAMARQHEKPFLHALRVVERVRVARPEDADVDADVAERMLPRLEPIRRAVFSSFSHGARVPEVEDEPTVRGDAPAVGVSTELASFTAIPSLLFAGYRFPTV
jgi:hypothetical protein